MCQLRANEREDPTLASKSPPFLENPHNPRENSVRSFQF